MEGLTGMMLAALVAGTAARAQPAAIADGPTAGTLGVGSEVGFRINDRVGIRADAALLRAGLVAVDGNSDDIASEGRVRARSGSAMVDIYPLGGGFRISAGGRRGAMKATVAAMPTTNVTIGARNLAPAQVGRFRADYRVRDWAPAVTIGFAGEIARRLVAGIEAGVLFHGAPHIQRLRSDGGSLSSETGFAADLDRERMLIENDIDDYEFRPVVQASLAFRF